MPNRMLTQQILTQTRPYSIAYFKECFRYIHTKSKHPHLQQNIIAWTANTHMYSRTWSPEQQTSICTADHDHLNSKHPNVPQNMITWTANTYMYSRTWSPEKQTTSTAEHDHLNSKHQHLQQNMITWKANNKYSRTWSPEQQTPTCTAEHDHLNSKHQHVQHNMITWKANTNMYIRTWSHGWDVVFYLQVQAATKLKFSNMESAHRNAANCSTPECSTLECSTPECSKLQKKIVKCTFQVNNDPIFRGMKHFQVNAEQFPVGEWNNF